MSIMTTPISLSFGVKIVTGTTVDGKTITKTINFPSLDAEKVSDYSDQKMINIAKTLVPLLSTASETVQNIKTEKVLVIEEE